MRSVAEGRRIATGSALAALLGVPLLCASGAADTPPSIDYQALLASCHEAVCVHGSGFEGTPTHLTWHDITIVYTTRSTVVRADLGDGDVTSADSRNSNWTLNNHVQISMPQGHLSADHATMKIVSDHITTLTAQGEPAQFERYADGPALQGSQAAAVAHAHGHARDILYDVEHNQLELNGDAYLTAGCYELTSEHITYDLASEKLQADPHDNSKVQAIVKPGTSGCGPGTDKS